MYRLDYSMPETRFSILIVEGSQTAGYVACNLSRRGVHAVAGSFSLKIEGTGIGPRYSNCSCDHVFVYLGMVSSGISIYCTFLSQDPLLSTVGL